MLDSRSLMGDEPQPDFWGLVADAFDPPPVELERASVFPTAGELAQKLDPLTVQTPALDVVDAELVQVRDAIAVMLKRRALFADLVHRKIPHAEAIRQAEAEIADAGNRRLCLSMSPQEGKTSRVARTAIVWFLQQFPGLRIGLVSYDSDHAARISFTARSDVELHNGEDGTVDLGIRLAQNQRAMSRWILAPPHEGGVYAVGIGGGLTGRPLDLLIIDDPVKDLRAADSLKMSLSAWEWWQTVARPRLAPWAPAIIDGTRWHELDLQGRLIAKQAEDEAAGLEQFDRWKIVNIPAEADHDPLKGETDILGREPGEFMVSARGRTREQWQATKAATSARFWSALYQGRPSPGVGDVWLKDWWRRYATPMWTQQIDGSFAVQGADQLIQSWDFAFKDKATSDYVCGQVWARFGPNAYLIYQRWARLDFTASLDAMRDVTRLFPESWTKIVEAKANGDAVMSTLRQEMTGIVAATPTQSKEARATAVSPFLRAGNVWLPTMTAAVQHPALAWDPDGLIAEATAFPRGAHDDQVDAASQALAELFLGGGVRTASRAELAALSAVQWS